MIRQLIRSKRRQILIDLNTQNDFFLPEGASCVRHSKHLLANIRRIFAWARYKKIHVISTSLVYPNNNGCNELGYCLDGTKGQQKIGYSLLNNRTAYPADNDMNLPFDVLGKYQQIILNTRTIDPFEEPRIERLLSEIEFTNFILIGAITEKTVKATALGLLQRGKHVTVISDAVGTANNNEGKLALKKVKAKGGKLIETRKIAGTSNLKHNRDLTIQRIVR